MNVQQSVALLFVVALMSAAAQSQVVKSEATNARTNTAGAKVVESKLGAPKVPSKPGLWQTTVNSAMDSGGTREGRAIACVSPNELRNVESMLPRYVEVGMRCANTNLKLNGATATWQIGCTSTTGASIAGVGKLAFSAEIQSGTAALVRKEAGKTTNIKQQIEARFIATC